MKKEFTYKDIENMLYRYNTLKAEIVDIGLDILSIQQGYTGIAGASDNEKPSTPTNAYNSSVENEVISKVTNIDKLEKVKGMKEIQVKRIDNMLTTIRDDEREIVDLKYFKRTRIKMIAYKLNVSEETIKKSTALIISSLVDFLNKK